MFLQGGASQLDMYDMKPSAPLEIRGKYHPIATNVPGIQLSDQLPKLARCADKFSLIRSMHSYANDHGAGDVDIMCGSPRDKNMQAPGIGAVLTKQQKQLAPVPPFVHLGDMKHPRHSAPGYGGYLGNTFDPFLIKQDVNSADFSLNCFSLDSFCTLNVLSNSFNLEICSVLILLTFSCCNFSTNSFNWLNEAIDAS